MLLLIIIALTIVDVIANLVVIRMVALHIASITATMTTIINYYSLGS